MNTSTRLVGLALVTLATVGALLVMNPTLGQTQAPLPTDLAAHWTGPGQATISWTQLSDADYVCLDKLDAAGDYTPIVCFDSQAGPHKVVLPFPTGGTDAAYHPQAGDRYGLHEVKYGTVGDNIVEDFGYSQRSGPLGSVYLPAVFR